MWSDTGKTNFPWCLLPACLNLDSSNYSHDFHHSDLRCPTDARLVASLHSRQIDLKYSKKFDEAEQNDPQGQSLSWLYLEVSNAIDEWYVKWSREITAFGMQFQVLLDDLCYGAHDVC